MQEYPIPAVGVFIFHDDSICLIKKGRGIFCEQWCTPGGKIELGESILDAVNREVLEETNLKINNIQFITYEQTIEFDVKGKKYRHFVFLNFKANIESGIPKACDDAKEIKFISFSDLEKYDLSEPTIRTLKMLGIYNAKVEDVI